MSRLRIMGRDGKYAGGSGSLLLERLTIIVYQRCGSSRFWDLFDPVGEATLRIVEFIGGVVAVP